KELKWERVIAPGTPGMLAGWDEDGNASYVDPDTIGGGGGIGGTTGTVDNRVLRADGTGGSTLQPSNVTIDDIGNVRILGTSNPSTPVTRLTVGVANNSVSSPTRPLLLYHSGSSGLGNGPGIIFAARTSGTNDEMGVFIDAIVTETTVGAEAFDFVVSTM